MKTRSIDIAAYLHLHGIEPDRVSVHPIFKASEFTYYDTGKLQEVLVGFINGREVPARAFAEARARMKSLGGSDTPVVHFRRAVDEAVRQIRKRIA